MHCYVFVPGAFIPRFADFSRPDFRQPDFRIMVSVRVISSIDMIGLAGIVSGGLILITAGLKSYDRCTTPEPNALTLDYFPQKIAKTRFSLILYIVW